MQVAQGAGETPNLAEARFESLGLRQWDDTRNSRVAGVADGNAAGP